jgi:hypothetical protein
MAEEQAGFRAGRSTVEQIFSLRLIAEKYTELQEHELYLVFIDFKKAFDRVPHEVMWRIMEHYGMQPKIVALLRELYNRAESAVIVGQDTTGWFKQTVGVRQGCILSPDLFNLCLEHIMRAALDKREEENAGAKIGGLVLNNLRFADDISLIAEQLQQAQALLESIDKEALRYGQEISDTKTEWMRVRREADERNEQILLPLQEVTSFKYLGGTITTNCDTVKDISIRTATALKVMSDLDKTWKDKNKDETISSTHFTDRT